MAPILFLGLALAGGLALASRSSSSTSAKPAETIDLAMIDASEKAAPGAEIARQAIANSLRVNSLTLYEMTAVAIETQLHMPKTAGNVRSWAKMAQQGGQTIAGDDEVGGAEGYGDDDSEVGARRRRHRRVRKLHARHAATPLPIGPGPTEEGPAPLVEWANDDDDDDAGAGDDADEVGAKRRRGALHRRAGSKRLPDWLRFAATQSKLAGDPQLIKATAVLLGRMGYAEHAKIHLKEALGR